MKAIITIFIALLIKHSYSGDRLCRPGMENEMACLMDITFKKKYSSTIEVKNYVETVLVDLLIDPLFELEKSDFNAENFCLDKVTQQHFAKLKSSKKSKQIRCNFIDSECRPSLSNFIDYYEITFGKIDYRNLLSDTKPVTGFQIIISLLEFYYREFTETSLIKEHSEKIQIYLKNRYKASVNVENYERNTPYLYNLDENGYPESKNDGINQKLYNKAYEKSFLQGIDCKK